LSIRAVFTSLVKQDQSPRIKLDSVEKKQGVRLKKTHNYFPQSPLNYNRVWERSPWDTRRRTTKSPFQTTRRKGHGGPPGTPASEKRTAMPGAVGDAKKTQTKTQQLRQNSKKEDYEIIHGAQRELSCP
jgi:hypothetical protein